MPETPPTPDTFTPPAERLPWRPEPPPSIRPTGDRYWLHAVLLLATIVTTTRVGTAYWRSFQPDLGSSQLPVGGARITVEGLWYSLTLLAILGAHELGHYAACRFYRINASLPYFLPIPFPLTGTAGAFIRIRQPITTKSALFDIGVAGPFAGVLIAVPALFVGLVMSNLVPIPPVLSGDVFGEPLLFKFALWLVWGRIPDNLMLNPHPIAFAAWFGLLVTALNLLPIGQLDGGHVSYAVLGRRSFFVSIAAVGVAVGLCFYSYSWILWTALLIVLLSVFGWHHPPTWDDDVPLNRTRLWLAAVALALFAVCFTPAPIRFIDLIQPQ